MNKIVLKDYWTKERLEQVKFLWIQVAEDLLRSGRSDYDGQLNKKECDWLLMLIKRINTLTSFGYFLELNDLTPPKNLYV